LSKIYDSKDFSKKESEPKTVEVKEANGLLILNDKTLGAIPIFKKYEND
jgi:hypothetical protein